MAKNKLTFNIIIVIGLICILGLFSFSLFNTQRAVDGLSCEEAILDQDTQIRKITNQLSDTNNKLNQLLKITESIQKTQQKTGLNLPPSPVVQPQFPVRTEQTQQPPQNQAEQQPEQTELQQQQPPPQQQHQVQPLQQQQQQQLPSDGGLPRIPVVVISCNRAEYLRKTLNTLLERRPSRDFPIIISQDCEDAAIDKLLWDEFEEEVTVIRHKKKVEAKPHDMIKQYSAIAVHYQWMFTQIFDKLNFDAAIVIEDDMEISVDFFELFMATYPIMKQDPTIYCVSSWNDNGLTKFVKDPAALYRTDVFPGLGWMTTKGVWEEIKSGWPINYWDEYMREPGTRKNRVCIRPEISRNFNFGRDGTSKGEFWDTHIQYIKANAEFVKFSEMDISYLIKENYDPWFFGTVKNATIVSVNDILHKSPPPGDYRIIYEDINQYKTLARQIGLMPDEKEGMPRTSYKMVVPFHLGEKRIFLTPRELKY